MSVSAAAAGVRAAGSSSQHGPSSPQGRPGAPTRATPSASESRADLEHDLAALPAARDSLECRTGLCERKDRVDLGAKLACVHERFQFEQLLAVGLDDEVGRARHLL